MKKIISLNFILILLISLLAFTTLPADEYSCGRIKDVWPPTVPKQTGTTCKMNVQASSPQEAFDACKSCCEDNVIHKNIKGLGIVKGNEVTHIACPAK